MMTYAPPSDLAIADILKAAKTFAVVGASNKLARPSYGVMRYLLANGYRLVPVNPGLAGQEIHGQPVVADLSSISNPIDVVDVFRNSDAALDIVRAAIREKDRLAIKAVWMQIGVINEQAANEAAAAGLAVVMDRCPKIEHARLVA
ncbi:MAG: CoA-binding protein [Hyphomicrobium zavarzinii]|nr:CoA-binding protein [Hyphomicrobium zavarzinii]MBL8847382.1 CoA-binding protein [Hyphomicrobium zavarzinii]